MELHRKKRACCPTCRLVQVPAPVCPACGEGQPIAISKSEAFTEIQGSVVAGQRSDSELAGLYVRGTLVVLLGLGALAGVVLLAGDFVSGPLRKLVAVAVCVLTFVPLMLFYLGGLTFSRRFKRRLSAVRFVPGKMVKGGSTLLAGRVDPWRGVVQGPASEREAVVAAVEMRDPKGRLFFWAVDSPGFLLASDEGERVVVTGPMVVERATWQRPAVDGRTVLRRLGLRCSYVMDAVVTESVIQPGDEVEVQGEARQEPVAEFAAGYRDGGIGTVVRGTPGQPVRIRVRGLDQRQRPTGS
jgi:hypothetical protein